MKINLKQLGGLSGLAVAIAFVAAVVFGGETFAASYTWVGGSGAGQQQYSSMNYADNWSPAAVPSDGDSIVIPGAAFYSPVNDIPGGITLSGVNFSAAQGGGGCLAPTLTLEEQLTLTGDMVVDSGCRGRVYGPGSLVIANNLSISDIVLGDGQSDGTVLLAVDQGSTLTLSMNLLATNHVNLAGAGVLIIDSDESVNMIGNAPSTFSGQVVLNKTGGNTAGGNVVGFEVNRVDWFGTGSILVNNDSLLTFKFHAPPMGAFLPSNATIANQITLNTNDITFYSLQFTCMADSGCVNLAPGTLKVNHLILTSPSSIDAGGFDGVLDLAGTTINGQCTTLWASNGIFTGRAWEAEWSESPANIINYPPLCDAMGNFGAVPGVPNTAGQALRNPAVIVGAGVALAVVTFKLTSKKRAKK